MYGTVLRDNYVGICIFFLSQQFSSFENILHPGTISGMVES